MQLQYFINIQYNIIQQKLNNDYYIIDHESYCNSTILLLYVFLKLFYVLPSYLFKYLNINNKLIVYIPTPHN